MWGSIMRGVAPTGLQLTPPDDVESAWVDPQSGLTTDSWCEGAVQLPFIKGSVPPGGAPCRAKGWDWLRRIFK